MLFQYYPDTDMLYIQLIEGTSSESEEVAPGIVLDFNDQKQLMGVEVEDASKRIDLTKLELRAIPISNLIMSERASS